MAWSEEFSPGNAEPVNVTRKVVDDPFGITQVNAQILDNAAKAIDLIAFKHIITAASAAEQGSLIQLRHVDKASGGVLPSTIYDFQIRSFNFERAADTVNPRSWLIDTTVDWRKRYMFAYAVAIADTAFPGEANDHLVGSSIRITSTAGLDSIESTSVTSQDTHFGLCYTENGNAFDTTIANSDRAVRVVSTGTPKGFLTAAFASGTTASAESVTAGNLLLTLNTDAAGNTNRAYGFIIASGQFA